MSCNIKEFEKLHGKIVKGATLKKLGIVFVKVTNVDEVSKNVQFLPGINTRSTKPRKQINKDIAFFFSPIDYIGKFMDHGNGYREVTFAENEPIYVNFRICCANEITLSSHKILFTDLSFDVWRSAILMDAKNAEFLDQHNTELCEFVLKINGNAIAYMSDETKNNFAMCKLAISTNGSAIIYVSDDMRNNEELCKIAIKDNLANFEYVGDDMKNNKSLCKIVMQEMPEMFIFAGNDMRNDGEICKIVVLKKPEFIKLMGGKIRNNEEICKIVVHFDGAYLLYMSDNIRKNEEICKIARKTNQNSFRYMWQKVRNNHDQGAALDPLCG